MAIASYKQKGIAELVNAQLPAIQPKEYSSPIIDTKYIPTQALLAYVSGSRWYTNYYRQLIADNSDLKAFDPTQPSLYQQYDEIKDLEIRVESSLTASQDAATSSMVVTGSGIIYPNLIPNIGDAFTADIGDGNEGLFSIVNVTRKTFMHDSVFEIEYQLTAIVDQNPDLLTNLQSKVQNTYVFDRQLLEDGSNPVVLSQEYSDLILYRQSIQGLLDYYMNSFFSREHHTLVVPGQAPTSVYDSSLLKALLQVVSSFDNPNIRLIRTYDVSGDPYLSQLQFWDLMINGNASQIQLCNQKFGLVETSLFNNNPYLRTIHYSFIDYLLYPTSPDLTVSGGFDFTVKPLDGTLLTNTEVAFSTQQTGSIDNTLTVVNRIIPLIYPVLHDDYYVLSENFYNPTLSSSMSCLEILVKDYLNQKPLDRTKLNALLNACYAWPRLEQFYYIPILLILLKVTVNNYTSG